MKGVFINDFLRDDVDGDFYLFVFREVIIEIEVFDVGDEKFCSWIGDNTVEETFCGGDCGSGSNQQSHKIKKVSAKGESCAMSFCLIFFDITYKTWIGNLFVCWYCRFMFEIYVVGAFNLVANTLCESSEIVGKGGFPCVFIVSLY